AGCENGTGNRSGAAARKVVTSWFEVPATPFEAGDLICGASNVRGPWTPQCSVQPIEIVLNEQLAIGVDVERTRGGRCIVGVVDRHDGIRKIRVVCQAGIVESRTSDWTCAGDQGATAAIY